MSHEFTQADLDRMAENLRAEGYAYIGSAEHNYLKLESDGRIRSVWTNDAGEFEETEDDSIQTLEEWEESWRAWYYDY